MQIRYLSILIFLQVLNSRGPATELNNWIIEKHPGYQLHYTEIDRENKEEYLIYIDCGIKSVKNFFGDTFKKEFEIFIHPDRISLDTQWRKDWNLPDFKSECWMVASGVADKLDMISPKFWDKEACEHNFSDKIKIQLIITHELVHVFHGQKNISSDFSDVTGVDWFVEGLATYASGQCDTTSIPEIRNFITENKTSLNLDNVWSGKLRYKLSGSLVMYIDNKFGRSKLKELLKFNRKEDILKSLNLTESALLTGWINNIGG